MRIGPAIAALALMLGLGSPQFAAAKQPAARTPPSSFQEPVVEIEGTAVRNPALQFRACGTPNPSPAELGSSSQALRRYHLEGGKRAAGGTVRVAFHVITSKGQGAVTDEQIAAQIRELNRNYAGSGFRFELASVDRTENSQWFKMLPGTGKEASAKRALAVDPAHWLNLYTCAPGQRLLGWAYFPFSAAEDHWIHGVVVHYASLPGGALARYNLGRTASHEIGHYLGLFHSFQNGCSEPGDEVEDTPFEASPAFGCPAGRNTCPQPGDDPVHNYMDYSDDACLTEFSSGQHTRMQSLVAIYRPSLFEAALARVAAHPEIVAEASLPGDAPRTLEFRGAVPNPFRSETAIRFNVPRAERVRLEIYNVAGQLVRTLMDAHLPPGEHSAMFRPAGLPSGMYFASLRVGGVQMNRSLVLIQ